MKKYLSLIIICLLLVIVGCSSGENRKKISESIGEVIYQKYPTANNTIDMLIVKNKLDDYLVVFVSQSGTIYKIEKLNIKCERE